MPRDATGKNRKFGQHKERNVEELTEESLMAALSKAKVQGNSPFKLSKNIDVQK